MSFAARVAAFCVIALTAGATIFTSIGLPGRSEPAASSATPVDIARRQLAEAERLHGPDALETAAALFALSTELRFAAPEKNREEGISSARRALTLREAQLGPDHPDLAASLELVSIWLWDARDLEAERPLIERALAIRERAHPPDEARIAADLHLLSDLHRVEGDFGPALELQERSGPYWARASGPDSEDMAVHHHYLAVIQAPLGELDAALVNVRRAVEIRERNLPATDPSRLARSLNLWGRLLLDAGDHAGAQRVLERALAIWEGSKNKEDVALALANLGRLHAERRNWDRAADRYTRAVAIRTAELGPDHPLVARALADLGAVQRRLGNFADARVSLARALRVQDGSRRASYPDWAATLKQQSLLDGEEGRFEQALASALETERLTRDYFRASALGLSEREALALAQQRARVGGLDPAWTWAARMAERGTLDERQSAALLDEAIRSRALVLDTLASRRRILALHQDAETARLVGDLARAQGRLTHLLMAATGWRSDWERSDVMSQAQAAADRAERTLAAKSREYRLERERGEPGLDDVRRSLPDRTALLSYFRYGGADDELTDSEGTSYAACVILPGRSAAHIIPLGDAKAIDLAVAAWRDAVSQDPRPQGAAAGEAAYLLAAKRLAERIWQPVQSHLADAGQVFVVPDGALQYVSFATLVTPGGTYLVESGHAFHYLTTERDLVAGTGMPPSEAGEQPSLLALGDPAYGAGSARADRRFDPLPGSRAEAADVASLWSANGKTRLLTGDAATEDAFKQLAPSFRVLHIATHGFETEAAAGESPLRVAGLALAGANRPAAADDPTGARDGILTAEEIASMDLRRVDWAVLSACATGGGALQPGEGVLGLRRTFQLAGAHALIVSLWPVDDDATRYWMRALYTSRSGGASTMDAVRDAMRQALSEQRRAAGVTHPYYWGAFVSVGDWR